jgi:amino acid permease
VFEDYKGVTRRRWSRVVVTTLVLTVTCWTLAGVSGFMLFGSSLTGNVLDSFSTHDTIAVVARAALSLNIMASVPYYVFMPRLSGYAVITLLFGKISKSAYHLMATTIIVVSSFLVAMFVENLTAFSDLVGVAAISLGFILPTLMFLRLEPGVWWGPKKLTHWVILIIGVLSALGVVGSAVAGEFGYNV